MHIKDSTVMLSMTKISTPPENLAMVFSPKHGYYNYLVTQVPPLRPFF